MSTGTPTGIGDPLCAYLRVPKAFGPPCPPLLVPRVLCPSHCATAHSLLSAGPLCSHSLRTCRRLHVGRVLALLKAGICTILSRRVLLPASARIKFASRPLGFITLGTTYNLSARLINNMGKRIRQPVHKGVSVKGIACRSNSCALALALHQLLLRPLLFRLLLIPRALLHLDMRTTTLHPRPLPPTTRPLLPPTEGKHATQVSNPSKKCTLATVPGQQSQLASPFCHMFPVCNPIVTTHPDRGS